MTAGSMKNKKVLIAGIGKSGIASFNALQREGALLSLYDDRDIEKQEQDLYKKIRDSNTECFFNGKPVTDMDWDLIVLSPGVPLGLPFIERARIKGIKIIGEIELAYILSRGKYVAITGTNGKTTTTTLAGELFKAGGLKTIVAGNIGTPVTATVQDAEEDAWFVTEVSSFQLETIDLFKPKIAALLNLTPDHMDRHKTMDSYAAAKARIFENQDADDFLVYNADDELVSILCEKALSKKLPFSRKKQLEKGAFVLEGMIVLAGPELTRPVHIIETEEIKIPGAHNLENALAAAAVAFAAGITPPVIKDVLGSFAGVEHRIEFVTEVGGVKFVNDSKGTNPDAAIKAVEAVGEKSKVLLIAGGYDKDADYTELIKAIKGRVKKLLLIGETAEKIKENAIAEGYPETDIYLARGMGEAVRLGFYSAEAGDTVLLSPACASWDMYKNYEERGAQFKSLAKELEVRK